VLNIAFNNFTLKSSWSTAAYVIIFSIIGGRHKRKRMRISVRPRPKKGHAANLNFLNDKQIFGGIAG
jgi:hypothetical protein